MGELTQLRGSYVFEQNGIWAIKISPEAGTVKNNVNSRQDAAELSLRLLVR